MDITQLWTFTSTAFQFLLAILLLFCVIFVVALTLQKFYYLFAQVAEWKQASPPAPPANQPNQLNNPSHPNFTYQVNGFQTTAWKY